MTRQEIEPPVSWTDGYQVQSVLLKKFCFTS